MKLFILFNRLYYRGRKIRYDRKENKIMRKLIYQYNNYKYKRFTNGLLFAVISSTALLLCLSGIYFRTADRFHIMLFFAVAAVSLFMGLYSMFCKNKNAKEGKYKMNI
jgi:hypothetical protein